MQEFVKFDGKETRMYNDTLELEEKQMYYVTLTAVNEAELKTTQTTSGGSPRALCSIEFVTEIKCVIKWLAGRLVG